MDAKSHPPVNYSQLWLEMTDNAYVGPPASLSRGRSHLVRCHAWHEAFPERDFVGVTDCKTLQAALYPRSYAERPRLNPSGERTNRRGPGPGKLYAPNRDKWQEMVVIPFYRRPQEMCAWAYTDLDTLHYRPNPPDLEIPNAPDLYFNSQYVSHPKLRMASLNGTDTSRREAGLAMLSTAVSERSAFPGYVFATLAVEDAIRFQYRWIRNYWETLGDLPLVGAFDHGYYRTAAAWDCLANRQIILFGESLTPALLRQAIKCDGRLIVRKYLPNRMQLAIRDLRFIIQEWIKHALPWREFLQRVMFQLKTPGHYGRFAKLLIAARLPPTELGELFLGSNQQWQAFHHLLQLPEFTPLLKTLQRLRGVHCPCPLQERIWGKHKYPWITLRVEKKYLLSNGQVRWAGRVEDLKRQLYSFVVADGEIARGGLLKAVRRHLRARHQQEPVFENRNWHFSDRELTLPHIEVVPNADRLGFVSPVPEQWVFRLPQYGVRSGNIELDQKVPLVLPDCPAQGLEPPPPLSKELFDPLREPTPQTELFWAIQQVLYQLITARCECQQPLGVALTGVGVQVVLAQIGRILDTPIVPMPGPRYWEHHLEQLSAKLNAYDWPTVINTKGRSPRTITRLLTELIARQCLCGIPLHLSATAQQQGWLVLEVPATASLPVAWEPQARQVLLQLLHLHLPGQFGKAREFPWQLRVRELLSERLSPWGDFRPVLRLAGKLMYLSSKS